MCCVCKILIYFIILHSQHTDSEIGASGSFLEVKIVALRTKRCFIEVKIVGLKTKRCFIEVKIVALRTKPTFIEVRKAWVGTEPTFCRGKKVSSDNSHEPIHEPIQYFVHEL